MITNKGFCEHKDGGFPSSCESIEGVSIEILETLCTEQPSCSGYMYHTNNLIGHPLIGSFIGYLFLPDDSCPDGFSWFGDSYNTAETMNDLVAKEGYPYVCYGKNIGISILQSERFF